MATPTVKEIEQQLKYRVQSYPETKWGGFQTNFKDNQTKFIYDESYFKFDDLLKHMNSLQLESSLIPYAVNRWYNYWSAKGIEQIVVKTFADSIAETNTKNKYQDFYIGGIPYDHKTTVFPKGFGKSYEYARQNPEELLDWLYTNQSPNTYRNSVKYTRPQNRLYVVMYAKNGAHWKLRSELTLIYNVLLNRSEDYIINRSDGSSAIYKLFWFVK